MITGAKFWDKDYYDQKNNAFEQQNKLKYGEKVTVIQPNGKSDIIHYSEMCGPTSAINCLSALGYDLRVYTAAGPVNVQPEDLLPCWMYQNKKTLLALHDGIENELPERVMANYPYSVNQLFKANAEFLGPWINWDRLVKMICAGGAVQILLPGHYVACVAYDDEKNEIIFLDSYYQPRQRLTVERYIKEVAQYYVHYFPKI